MGASGDVMLVRGRYLRRDFEFYDKKSGAIYVEAEKAIIRDRFKIRIQPGVDIALMICMCVMIGNQQYPTQDPTKTTQQRNNATTQQRTPTTSIMIGNHHR